MGHNRLSALEADYIREGVQCNMRLDGRERLDSRAFSLETGVLAQANGSSRVRLANTDILVGIKVEIGDVDPDFPDQGRLHVYVECSPSASLDFEGRGADILNAQLMAILNRVLHTPSSIDWRSLCISPGRQCWIVYVDALVLDSGGNLFDALAIATRAALFNTRIPKINVVESRGEGGEITTEIEVSDDPSEVTRLDVHNIPLTITFAKIGGRYVVDPCLEEEMCTSTRLTVAVNLKGNICAIQKGGLESGLDPSEIHEMLQVARKIGLTVIKKLDDLLAKDDSTSHLPRAGFLRAT